MKDINVTIGRNIKHLRINAGMTQRELGDRLSEYGQDRSIVSISNYESGRTAVSGTLLTALASIFNCSTDKIIGSGAPEENPDTNVAVAKVLRNMADLLEKNCEVAEK